MEDQWAKSDPLVDGMNLNIDQLDDHDNEVAMISQAHLQNMMKKRDTNDSRDQISHNEIELQMRDNEIDDTFESKILQRLSALEDKIDRLQASQE